MLQTQMKVWHDESFEADQETNQNPFKSRRFIGDSARMKERSNSWLRDNCMEFKYSGEDENVHFQVVGFYL